MNDDSLLPFERFAAWLAQFGDNTVVGLTLHVEQCPIARCLRDLFPSASITITPTAITIISAGTGHCFMHIPALWLTAVIEQIDVLAPMNTDVCAGTLRAIVTDVRRFCDAQFPKDRESIPSLLPPICTGERAEVMV
jgi:hypothetical protein